MSLENVFPKEAFMNEITMVGKKGPVPMPCNCKNPCCYGYGRSFCFPCYAQILGVKPTAKK